eukprot:938443-Pleurochrysis_carterae.AAC.2
MLFGSWNAWEPCFRMLQELAICWTFQMGAVLSGGCKIEQLVELLNISPLVSLGAHFRPRLEVVACKPILFDIARNQVRGWDLRACSKRASFNFVNAWHVCQHFCTGLSLRIASGSYAADRAEVACLRADAPPAISPSSHHLFVRFCRNADPGARPLCEDHGEEVWRRLGRLVHSFVSALVALAASGPARETKVERRPSHPELPSCGTHVRGVYASGDVIFGRLPRDRAALAAA